MSAPEAIDERNMPPTQPAKSPGRPRATIAIAEIWNKERKQNGDSADLRVRLLLLRDACHRRALILKDVDFASYAGLSRSRMHALLHRGVGKFDEWTVDPEGPWEAIGRSYASPAEMLLQNINAKIGDEGSLPADYFSRAVNSINEIEAMLLALKVPLLSNRLEELGAMTFLQNEGRQALQNKLLNFIFNDPAPPKHPLFVVFAENQHHGLKALAHSLIESCAERGRASDDKLPIVLFDLLSKERQYGLGSLVKELADHIRLPTEDRLAAELEPERVLANVAEHIGELPPTLFVFVGYRADGGDPLAATRQLVRDDPALEVLVHILLNQPMRCASRFIVFAENRPTQLCDFTSPEHIELLPPVRLGELLNLDLSRLKGATKLIDQGVGVDKDEHVDDTTCDLLEACAALDVPVPQVDEAMQSKAPSDRKAALTNLIMEKLTPLESTIIKVMAVAEVGLLPEVTTETLRAMRLIGENMAGQVDSTMKSLASRLPGLIRPTRGNCQLFSLEPRSETKYEILPQFGAYLEENWFERNSADAIEACRALAGLADKQASHAREEANGQFGRFLRDYRPDILCFLLLGKSLVESQKSTDGVSTPTRPFVGDNPFVGGASNELVARCAYDSILLHILEKWPQFRLTRDFGADDIRVELLSLLILGRRLLARANELVRKSPGQIALAKIELNKAQLSDSLPWANGDGSFWRARKRRILVSLAVAAFRQHEPKLVDTAIYLATGVADEEDQLRLWKVKIDNLIRQGDLEKAYKFCMGLLEIENVSLPKIEDIIEKFENIDRSDGRKKYSILCRFGEVLDLMGEREIALKYFEAVRVYDNQLVTDDFIGKPILTGHPSRVMLSCAISRAVDPKISVAEHQFLSKLIQKIHEDNWRRMGDVQSELPWLLLESSALCRGLIRIHLNEEGSDADTIRYLRNANGYLTRVIPSLWRSGMHLSQAYFHYLLEYAELKLLRYEFYIGACRLGFEIEADLGDAIDHATFLIDLLEKHPQPLLKAEASRVLAEAVIKATDQTLPESSRPPGLDAAKATAMKSMAEAIKLVERYPKRHRRMEDLATTLRIEC